MPTPAQVSVCRHYAELYTGRGCTLNGMPARICAHGDLAAIIVGPIDQRATDAAGRPTYHSAIFPWHEVREVMTRQDEHRACFHATPVLDFLRKDSCDHDERVLIPPLTLRDVDFTTLHERPILLIYQMMLQAGTHGQRLLCYKLAEHLQYRRASAPEGCGEPVPYLYDQLEFDDQINRTVKYYQSRLADLELAESMLEGVR